MLTQIYLCPSDKKYACSWEGSSDDILNHFNTEHDDLISFGNAININLSVLTENYLLLFDEEVYLLQTRTVDDQLQIFLRYLGPPKIAAQLNYDINIECANKTLDKHNIQLQDNCFAVSVECIKTYFGDINVVNCIILVHKVAKSTSSDDGVDLDDDKSINLSTDSAISKADGIHQEPSLSVRSGSLSIHNKRIKSAIDETPPSAVWYSDGPSHTNLQRSSSCVTTSKQKIGTKRTGSTLRAINETDLDLELRCSNCGRHISIPIFLCLTRHNICNYCYSDQKYCKLCEKDITPDRNIELEKRSEGHLYTCRYKSNGCPERHAFNNINHHETNCVFCTYVCPMEECGFHGSFKPMVSHLNLIHSSIKMFESFIAVFAKYTELFLANEKMGIFYCTMKIIDNEKVLWTAKFSGPQQQKYFCELKFKNKNFKYPILLTKQGDHYIKEMTTTYMKEHKLKSKNSLLTITR